MLHLEFRRERRVADEKNEQTSKSGPRPYAPYDLLFLFCNPEQTRGARLNDAAEELPRASETDPLGPQAAGFCEAMIIVDAYRTNIRRAGAGDSAHVATRCGWQACNSHFILVEPWRSAMSIALIS